MSRRVIVCVSALLLIAVSAARIDAQMPDFKALTDKMKENLDKLKEGLDKSRNSSSGSPTDKAAPPAASQPGGSSSGLAQTDTPAKPQPRSASLDACTLVTASEAAAALGVDGVRAVGHTRGMNSRDWCSYLYQNGREQLDVRTEGTSSIVWNSARSGGEAKAVSGLAEEAYIHNPDDSPHHAGLYFRKGKNVIRLEVNRQGGLKPGSIDRLLKLGRLVASRIPSEIASAPPTDKAAPAGASPQGGEMRGSSGGVAQRPTSRPPNCPYGLEPGIGPMRCKDRPNEAETAPTKPQPRPASLDACTLVAASEAAALLGGEVRQRPVSGGGCTFEYREHRNSLNVETTTANLNEPNDPWIRQVRNSDDSKRISGIADEAYGHISGSQKATVAFRKGNNVVHLWLFRIGPLKPDDYDQLQRLAKLVATRVSSGAASR